MRLDVHVHDVQRLHLDQAGQRVGGEAAHQLQVESALLGRHQVPHRVVVELGDQDGVSLLLEEVAYLTDRYVLGFELLVFVQLAQNCLFPLGH